MGERHPELVEDLRRNVYDVLAKRFINAVPATSATVYHAIVPISLASWELLTNLIIFIILDPIATKCNRLRTILHPLRTEAVVREAIAAINTGK